MPKILVQILKSSVRFEIPSEIVSHNKVFMPAEYAVASLVPGLGTSCE